MANFMMNPVLPGLTPGALSLKGNLVSSQEGTSFATYIEQKSAEFDSRKNMLGANGKTAVSHKEVGSQKETSDELAATSVSGLLQQFMAKLNELAQGNENGVGEWQLTGVDLSTLKNLTEKAGMESTEFSSLITKTEDGGSTLGIVDLFAALESTFSNLDQAKPVVAPETSLPLLQTILSKLGLSAEEISKISEPSVNDFGGFDLGIFLDRLNQLGGTPQDGSTSTGVDLAREIPLTGWEVEQLQDMLSAAGLSKETAGQLFPEITANMFRDIQGGEGRTSDLAVMMDLDRLKAELQQTITEVEGLQPKVDLPEFLSGLKNVLGQVDFKDGGVGWSPVIQNTITSVFEELQKIVDLSDVKIEYSGGDVRPVWDMDVNAEISGTRSQSLEGQAVADTFGNNGSMRENVTQSHLIQDANISGKIGSETVLQAAVGGEKVEPIVVANKDTAGQQIPMPGSVSDINATAIAAVGEEKMVVGAPVRKAADETVKIFSGAKESLTGTANPDQVNLLSKASEDLSNNGSQDGLNQEKSLQMPIISDEIQYREIAAKATSTGPHAMRSPMQNLAFEQISSTVIRGLRDLEHQLTLTLYPKELGEVKVDMFVRDNQVSLSFLMENPKVKEVLESNMQDFSKNMAQNGFQLGECSVSVGQHNESGFQEHQFASGGQRMNEMARKANLAEINEIVSAGIDLRSSYHDGQLSVIA